MKDAVDRALAGFGAHIGMVLTGTLTTSETQFLLDDGAQLGLCLHETDLLVWWAQPLRASIAERVAAAMQRAGQVNGGHAAVQAGLRSTGAQDWMVLGMRLDASTLDESSIRDAVQYLNEWQDGL